MRHNTSKHYGLTAKLWYNERFAHFTWNYLRRRSQGHRILSAPVFIVGSGHCGTTVLLRLLGAHSQIYSVPFESKLFTHPYLKRRLTAMIWNRNAIASENHRWVEKTPKHIRFIDRIFADYPDARVFCMVRDGRDVTVSMRKRFGDFETGLEVWGLDNSHGVAWRDDPRVMQVRYEDLVGNFQNTMREACTFIDEEFEESIIDFHEKPAYIFAENIRNPGSGEGIKHAEFRNWQINQKLFDGSGKWKQEMTGEEKEIFKADEIAMRLMTELGYAHDTNW
ncbi:MAG: sulfotransferase [Pseudomonadota bacterium]